MLSMRFQHLAIALALSAVPTSASAAGITSSPYSSPWGISRARSRAFSSRSLSPAATSTSTSVGLLSRVPRGGADSTVAEDATSTSAAVDGEEKSLDEKVREAMKKYGLNPDVDVPVDDDVDEDGDDAGADVVGSTEMTCEGGICEMPSKQEAPQTEEDINEMADRIAGELEVDRQIVMAALGATATGEGDYRRVDETLARELIVAERDAISGVTEDCDEVRFYIIERFHATSFTGAPASLRTCVECVCFSGVKWSFDLLLDLFVEWNPERYFICFPRRNQTSCGILSQLCSWSAFWEAFH